MQAKRGAGPRQRKGETRRGISRLGSRSEADGESRGHRVEGEALALKRRGAPQDCADRGRLCGAKRKEPLRTEASLRDFHAVMVGLYVSRISGVGTTERQELWQRPQSVTRQHGDYGPRRKTAPDRVMGGDVYSLRAQRIDRCCSNLRASHRRSGSSMRSCSAITPTTRQPRPTARRIGPVEAT